MTYPSVAMAAEPEPPLSLTASDGTGLALVSLDARAVIDGPLAFTELHLRFRNPRDRVIEGRFAIALPPEATISRLAMRLSTGWQEAEIVERQLARRAYEDFLHRRQDPALLEKAAGNEFQARIFPIPANGEKDIIISYSQPLVGRGVDDRASYRLPLRGLPQIDHLKVSALVAEAKGATLEYRTVTMDERDHKPTKDFDVSLPASIAGIATGELIAARLQPDISTETQRITSLVVLFDTSASRAPGFSTQVKQLGQLMSTLASTHDKDMHVEVAAFDQMVVPIYSGSISGFNDDALDKLRAHRPLGASNLDGALAWVATRAVRSRLLIVSDAIPTMGPTDAEALQTRLRALAPATERTDIVLAGGIRNQALAHALTRGVLARDGVVLDAREPVEILARRLAQTTVSGVQVVIPGAEWLWPERLDGLQPGDEVLVFASLGRAKPGATIELELSGSISQKQRIPLTQVARPLLERAAVAARVARLTHERSAMAADKRDARDALQRRIVELSTRYRVLSDFTALLVLETEDDYKRYGIDRRALADILTVGNEGVEVFHRQVPILMIADSHDVNKNAGKQTDEKEDKSGPKKPADAIATRSFNGGSSGRSVEKAVDMDMDTNIDNDADGIVDVADADMGSAEIVIASGVHVERARPDERPRPDESAPTPEPESESDESAGAPPGDRGDTISDDQSRAADGVERRVARESETVIARPPPATDSTARPVAAPKPEGPSPYSGKLAEIVALLEKRDVESALVQSIRWQSEEPGDVMALIALGESLEHTGRNALAARAYGSIIDLFPARADMRRFAGERLERFDALGLALAADSYAKGVAQRPDHLTGHRLLAYALVRMGEHERAFAAVEAGLARRYPDGRFAGGERILREDLGLIAAAWIQARPEVRESVVQRLSAAGAEFARTPSLRFVLNWETDANDVDFHIYDSRGGHAFYSQKELPSGGALYADVTTGYGPECFTIEGTPSAYPYHLQIHYYSRGPMGYGMGKLEIVEHDGNGQLRLEQRPFVVMNDGAYVDLGEVVGDSAH